MRDKARIFALDSTLFKYYGKTNSHESHFIINYIPENSSINSKTFTLTANNDPIYVPTTVSDVKPR